MRGAKRPRLEFTEEQVEEARREMDKSKIVEIVSKYLTGKRHEEKVLEKTLKDIDKQIEQSVGKEAENYVKEFNSMADKLSYLQYEIWVIRNFLHKNFGLKSD